MAQFFNNKKFTTSFEDHTNPQLLFVCKAERAHTNMPRVMHRHEHQAEIVFIKEGSGVHTIGEKQYQTRKGDILLYNSGVIHDECANPNESLSVYACGITGLMIKGLAPNQFIPNNMQAVISAGDNFSEIHNLFEMLHSYTLDSAVKSAEISNYLLRALLVILLNIIEGRGKYIEQDSKNIAMRIKNYIDIHCFEDINLHTISKDLNMNQYYLSHSFKEMVGYSPIQYVIRRRIGEAQSLLINTDYEVTKIATMVGYNNTNHFHGIFVKMIGMSPGRYRKHWVKERHNDIKGK